MNIHIGEKIREVVEKRGITKTELSRRLNMTSTNVHKIFKRKSIDTGLLTNISHALEFDFYIYLNGKINTNEFSGSRVFHEDPENYQRKTGDLSKEFAKLRQEYQRMEKEFAKKEIDYLKKINSLLQLLKK